MVARVRFPVGRFFLVAAFIGCGDHGVAPDVAAGTNTKASASTTAHAPPEHATLAILQLADEVEPFPAPPKDLPRGGMIQNETAPIGTTRQEVPKEFVEKVCVAPVECKKDGDKTVVDLPIAASHAFLRVVSQPGESIDDTEQRTNAYLLQVKPPEGTRFMLGRIIEIDRATKHATPVGVRSYLVRGESPITEKDVVDAQAKSDPTLVVRLTLSADAASRLAGFTQAVVHHRLAVAIDGNVVTAPALETPITGNDLSLPRGVLEKPMPDEIDEATRVAKALRPPH